MTASDPTTKAGRDLFSRLWAVNDYDGASRAIAFVRHDITQIEAEAVAAALADLAEKVAGLPTDSAVAGGAFARLSRRAVLALITDAQSKPGAPKE